MNKRLFTMVVLVLLVITNTVQLGWARKLKKRGGEPYANVERRFTVTFPAGWTFEEGPAGHIRAIIDNEIHQRMIFKYTGLEDPLPHTQRKITPDLKGQELAQAIIDDLIAAKTTEGLGVLESGPAEVDGQPGCKFVVRFRNREIGRADMVKRAYAVVHDSQLYVLMYDAMAADFYERGLPAFEETIKTFKFSRP